MRRAEAAPDVCRDWGRASILTDPTVHLAMILYDVMQDHVLFSPLTAGIPLQPALPIYGAGGGGRRSHPCYEFLCRGNIRLCLIISDDVHPC